MRLLVIARSLTHPLSAPEVVCDSTHSALTVGITITNDVLADVIVEYLTSRYKQSIIMTFDREGVGFRAENSQCPINHDFEGIGTARAPLPTDLTRPGSPNSDYHFTRSGFQVSVMGCAYT
jgi:hypothetical protein